MVDHLLSWLRLTWNWIFGWDVSTIIALLTLLVSIGALVASRRQGKTSQRSLLEGCFQKGVESLGSEDLSGRLAGIDDLRRLAEDYPQQYHVRVMRQLCGFARFSPAIEALERDELSEDVLKVMEVVRGRSDAQITIEKKKKYRLELSEVNLPGAEMEGANLANADLVHANLTGANLTKANLSDTNLFHALLFGAILTKCKGLTQEQLDQATVRKKENPPNLDESYDAKTGAPLRWRV